MSTTPAGIARVLADAYKYGHAWNPSYPNLANIDAAAIAKMDGSERDAKDLIASRQASDINAAVLVAAFHNHRQIQYDGLVGPATLALVDTIERCPMPDFAPPPGAAFDFGDPQLNAAVESMQAWAEAYTGGNGAWPVSGCDPERKGMHSIRIRLNPAGAPSVWIANRDKIQAAIEASYADMGLSVRYLYDASSAAEITKEFTNLRGGTIGINYFPMGGCRVITGVLSRTYNPSDWRLHAELDGHEDGHGVGLQHRPGGRMNPSILLTKNVASWRGDPSEGDMTRMYGGVPIPGTKPPVPPDGPPKPPGPTSPVSSFRLDGKEYEVYLKGSNVPPVVIVV